jgi:hypothetical protein
MTGLGAKYGVPMEKQRQTFSEKSILFLGGSGGWNVSSDELLCLWCAISVRDWVELTGSVTVFQSFSNLLD